MLISPIPLLGPEDSILISLAIFINETAVFFRELDALTTASFAANASNLFLAVTNLFKTFLLSDIAFSVKRGVEKNLRTHQSDAGESVRGATVGGCQNQYHAET